MEHSSVAEVADRPSDPADGVARPMVGTIERALTVLDLMASSDQDDMGVTEIARQLGLSKAVIHRVLTTLAARDYLNHLIQTHTDSTSHLTIRTQKDATEKYGRCLATLVAGLLLAARAS